MILDDGTVLHEHKVEKGDIWRSASANKAPIEDWVNLAIDRQKADRLRGDLLARRTAPMTRS
jgi:isocitrate dehydrogenase